MLVLRLGISLRNFLVQFNTEAMDENRNESENLLSGNLASRIKAYIAAKRSVLRRLSFLANRTSEKCGWSAPHTFASHHGTGLEAETFMEGSVKDRCVGTEKLNV